MSDLIVLDFDTVGTADDVLTKLRVLKTSLSKKQEDKLRAAFANSAKAA